MEDIKEDIKKEETVVLKKEKLSPSFDNLENSIKLWWKNLSLFLQIYIQALLYPAIAFVLTGLLMLLAYFVPSLEKMSFLLLFAQIVTIIISIYFIIRASLGIAIFINHDYQGNIKEIFKETKPYFWPYLFLSILSTVLIILWSLLLIIPGIIYSVFYSFAIFTFLFEGKRGMAALKGSRELVRGYFWPVFGRILLVSVLISVVMSIIAYPIEFFEEGSFIFKGMDTLINIIALIIAPLSTIFVYHIYKDLLRIKTLSQK